MEKKCPSKEKGRTQLKAVMELSDDDSDLWEDTKEGKADLTKGAGPYPEKDIHLSPTVIMLKGTLSRKHSHVAGVRPLNCLSSSEHASYYKPPLQSEPLLKPSFRSLTLSTPPVPSVPNSRTTLPNSQGFIKTT